MKKGLKIGILFLFFILFIPVVKAAPTVEDENCNSVTTAITQYELSVESISSLNCETITNTTNSDVDTINQCNEEYSKKANALAKLFRYNDTMPSCSTARLNEILEENKDDCSPAFSSSIKDFTDKVMTIFYILAPFLVIILGSTDFMKIVVSPNPREAKKNRKNFFRRVIAMVLIFLTPAITNLILSIGSSDLILSDNVYTCKKKTTFAMEHWSTTYVPRNTTSGSYNGEIRVNTVGTQAMLDAASQLYVKFNREQWTYGACSGSNIERSVNCPSKQLVCADLIAQVLYLGHIYTADEINSTKYNGCCGLYHFLIDKGWRRIESYNDLQPGDVVFFREDRNEAHDGAGAKYYMKHTIGANGLHLEFGHVALYAGDGKWYDTGGDTSIVAGEAFKANKSGQFAVALRMP